MLTLPYGTYEKVIIHDNFQALYRFAKSKGKERTALGGLIAFNGRFIAFNIDNVSFISTGMGSAQTSCLVEALGKSNCQIIVKVGTCSALGRTLEEADIIVPCAALVDEGATYWRQVKKSHDQGKYQTQASVNSYIDSKKLVRPDKELRKKLIERVQESELKNKLKTKELEKKCVWSVDSYDCFDGSYELYSKVNGEDQYTLQDFHSGSSVRMGIVGVEMECSALFASAHDLNMPAAALIVVSRAKKRLLKQNVPAHERAKYGIGNIGCRNDQEIQEIELGCIEVAMDVVRNWQVESHVNRC